MNSHNQAPAESSTHETDVILTEPIILGGLDITPCLQDSTAQEVAKEEGLEGVFAFKGVSITDLWHLSPQEIEDFTDEGMGEYGRFGQGTYVGGGNQTGDQIRDIQRHDHVRHDLNFRGNALFVPYDQMFDLGIVVAEQNDLSSHGTRELNKLLIDEKYHNSLVPGMSVHAVFFYDSNKEVGEQNSEGVIFYPSNHLHTVAAEAVAA